MRVEPVTHELRAARRRLASEDGFTMLVAIGVLAVSALLVGAVWLAVRGDVTVTQHDLDGKRAYAAARAAENIFLYDLNQNPNYWATCSNDTAGSAASPVAVPGSSAESYSWQPVPANGYGSCSATQTTASMVDNTTGTLRMEFTGYSGATGFGASRKPVTRTIVTSFRENTPFDYLWYTVYEQSDSSITGYNCAVWYRNNPPSQCQPIDWISQDVVNGPMYTEDQYHIGTGATPTFGRGPGDKIESMAPGSSPGNICAGNSCGGAIVKGTPIPNAGMISPPSSNSFLATDAASYGITYTGTTSIVLRGTSATVTNCPTSTCTTSTISDLTKDPVIYVANATGCTPPSYSPSGTTYTTNASGNPYGCAGDVYVSGTYTDPVTIGAANNIVITGNLQTTESGGAPTGNATLGLVANAFVRIEHGCSNGNNVSPYTQNLSLDAAILTLQHSFIVDNYDCGSPLGTLTVNGAIAQYFRGTVGTHNGATITSGYAKSYTYDNRLEYLLPPYLFDVSQAGWRLSRETLCGGASGSGTAC